MTLVPGPGEPRAGPWRVQPLAALVRLLVDPVSLPAGRPPILAVDGRGGSGKTTLAERLRAAVPGAAVVHTDDISWWHSEFGWSDLMIPSVLDPLHRGESVHFRPPAWDRRSRPGHIGVPAAAPLVIVEGVGASRRELSHLLDASVWVQSDFAEAERRGIRRDGGDAAAAAEWRDWMRHEIPFLIADRPWERATVIVAGTPVRQHDPVFECVLADRIRR